MTQLALLRGDHAFEGLRKKIVLIANLLEELQNIPMVAAELSDAYWQDITVPILETVRRRLRRLIKLIEYKKRAFVYSDFEDEIGAGDEIQVSGVPVGTDMDRFSEKARQFLMVNQNHIAILKPCARCRCRRLPAPSRALPAQHGQGHHSAAFVQPPLDPIGELQLIEQR